MLLIRPNGVGVARKGSVPNFPDFPLSRVPKVMASICSKILSDAICNLLVSHSSFFQKVVTVVDTLNTFEFVI